MNHGSGTPTYQDSGIDQTQLAQFMNTEQGKQFSNSYDPTKAYAQSGNSYIFYDPTKAIPGGHTTLVANYGRNGQQVDPTAMINAFKEWQVGNDQTKQSWNSYAEAVAANEGGQGDNTITTGAGLGQRQALLGALTNAGNPIPTTPTPGLGSFGTNTKPPGTGAMK